MAANKIEPFRPYFENMHALLARMAEDETIIGFAGCVLRNDGTIAPMTFGCVNEVICLIGAKLQHVALEDAERDR